MQANGTLERLPESECRRLLGSASFGRIVCTRQALPAVDVVNFAVDGADIVIRTDAGGKLAAATHSTVVAFEVDDIDPVRRCGWSVTAVGHSREVTDPDEITRLRRIGLQPWAPGDREHFIKITPGILNGRRLAERPLRTSGERHPPFERGAWCGCGDIDGPEPQFSAEALSTLG